MDTIARLSPDADTARGEKLGAWLDRNNAQLLWQRAATMVCPETSCYLICGQAVIVIRFKANRGWSIFVPPCDSNRVDVTLDHAAVLIGPTCQGSAGL